uniref:Uncharacterized protein n=1 Tax=Spongospora subterranea TaxID=70186 RepID=A0A0H5QQZ6_9EUKA|eukprot:CRZ04056.1 hypothetical protein [Spongospora subterranea]
MASSFSSEGIYVEQDVPIQGMSMTASVVPVVSSDETTFNDWVFHAYIIRGVNQTAWTKLIENQLVVQLCIMAVEMLTSAISLVLTYLPMRNFLSALERAFNVPSMSLKDKQRQQDKAAAALERLATSKPDTEAL